MNQHHSAGLIVVALLIVGCGGGGGHKSTPVGSGRAVMSVDWPARDRAIPYISNSLDVTITKAGKTVAHKVVNRPAGVAPHSDVEFLKLPSGSLQATIRAFPEPGALGTPQASGVSAFETSAGSVATIPVSLASTVTSLTINAPGTPGLGTTTPITMSARDAAGRTVLLRYGGFQERVEWNSSAPDVAAVQADGTSASLQCLSEGEATLTATFSPDGEAPISAQKNLTVLSSSGTVVIR